MGIRVACLCLLLVAGGCAKLGTRTPAEPWFTEHRVAAGGKTPFGVVAADFNGDKRVDLAVSNVTSDALALLLANPNGGFVAATQLPAGRAPRGVVAADLNRDGHMDLVVATAIGNTVEVFLGDGRGGATRKQYLARLAPFNVAVADLNRDGSLDLVVANESNIKALTGKGEISVLLGDGRGGFAAQRILEGGTNPADVTVADLNADGLPDLAVVNWKSQDISLFLGHGDGTFTLAPAIAYGGSPAYSLAVGDLNQDRQPDLAVGDLDGVVYLLTNSGAGNFTLAERLVAQPGVRCVIAADLNGDGRLDLATANTAADSVTVFLAKPVGGFEQPYHVRVGQRPRVVSAADLNGDGRTDLVVTNGGSDDVSVLINNGLGP